MGNLLPVEESFQVQSQNLGVGIGTAENKNPQQNLFTFDELGFDSRFEGGNLMYADKAGPGQYNLWIAPDCYRTQYETQQRAAFYFKVMNVNLLGLPTRTITFRIMNMDENQAKNYREGMVPVYLSANNNNAWHYLPAPLTDLNSVSKQTIEICFQYTFNLTDSQKGVYFAFTFPYTHTDCLNFVDYLEKNYNKHPSIYFHRELLTHSQEGRRLDLLTITGHDNSSLNPSPPFLLEPMIPNLFPGYQGISFNDIPTLANKHLHRPFIFRTKGYIFLTARIHAAESPANFMLQSLLLSLMNPNDPVSQALLQNFVFVVIPMLNPDGVYKGHYRFDLKGRDLNRWYDKAPFMPQELPGPYAVMELAKSYASSKKLAMYIDFHAHSQFDSGFILGPYHQDPEVMTEMKLFGRLLDIYSANFDFNCSKFGSLKESQDPEKAGVAKNAVRNLTGIIHSYTLEAGYHRTTKDPFRYSAQHNITQDLNKSFPKRVGITEFFEIGENIKHAMLESLLRFNPVSVLGKTFYGDVKNLRSNIYQRVIQEGEQVGEVGAMGEGEISQNNGSGESGSDIV